MAILDVVKVLSLTTVSFVITIFWTPLLTNFLYKHKLGKTIRPSTSTPIFSKLHEKKSGTPVMGGILVWGTTLILALLLYYLARWTEIRLFDLLNFLTRKQTLLPLGALISTALVGLADDVLNVRGKGVAGGGLSIRYKLLVYTVIALFAAFWFYVKLDWDIVHIPFWGTFSLGWWFVPVAIFVIVATAFSVNEADGLDGLAGGLLLASFGSYGVIAFVQGRIDLAGFCAVIVGALLAFLWFNIHPARFFMGDTGAMSLGTTLAVVAMLTNQVLLLPIIGFLFVAESLSVILQVLSRKLRGKKIFLSSPLHHHLEAIGWPETKIVMRFWIIASVTASMGIILFLMDR